MSTTIQQLFHKWATLAPNECLSTEWDYKEFGHCMGVVIPELISLPRGQVIGIVTIVDCQFSQVASGWGMPEQ